MNTIHKEMIQLGLAWCEIQTEHPIVEFLDIQRNKRFHELLGVSPYVNFWFRIDLEEKRKCKYIVHAIPTGEKFQPTDEMKYLGTIQYDKGQYVLHYYIEAVPMLTIDDKVIFLDIDGVLNTPRYISKYKGRHPIDPLQMKILNRLVEVTRAKIVVSSTWRMGTTIEELNDLLKRKGLETCVYSKTHVLNTERGVEINEWIRRYTDSDLSFNEFVILDDDSDMSYKHHGNFIHTPCDCGLTPSLAYKAANLLRSKRNYNRSDINSIELKYDNDIYCVSEYHKG